jgi:hypothetical protein
VTWSIAESGDGGTWNQGTGTYTSSKAGIWHVHATSGSVIGTATLIVNPAALDHFSFNTISSPQVAGTGFSITITAVDAYGNTATSYTGTNVFTDLTGTISATAGTWSNGVLTETATITQAWTADTVSVTGGGKSGGPSNPFNVNLGALDHFTMIGYPSSAIAGVSFGGIVVTAYDAYNNVKANYVSSVWFTSSDPQAGLYTSSSNAYTFTSGDNGVHTFAGFTLKTTPSQTITITDGSKSATSPSITVSCGALDHFTITDYPSSVTAGQSFDGIVVTAYDIYNNAKTDYAGQVYFISTDPLAVLPYTSTSEYTFNSGDNGAHPFAGFTLKTAGSQTITVTGTASKTSDSITVTAASVDHIVISPKSATVTLGDTQAYTATAYDAYDNSLGDVTASTSWSIVESGDGGSWSGSVYTPAKIGTWTAKGTYSGAFDTATLTVNPGAPASIILAPKTATIPAGGTQAYTATAYDAHGNSLGDVTASTSWSIVELGDGGSWSENVYTSVNAGTWTITGTYSSVSGTAILTVTAASQGLHVQILSPPNDGDTVSGVFLLTANCTDLDYGVGNINVQYQIGSSEWQMTAPPPGSVITFPWTAYVDTTGLSDGAYMVTVKGTRLLYGPLEKTDSITIHVDNSGITHKTTFFINYPDAAANGADGGTYDRRWWFEEDRFLPGETMGVHITGGSSVTNITISIDPTLIYPPLSTKYPATLSTLGSTATAVFPFDFSNNNPDIYGAKQVTVKICYPTICIVSLPSFTIEHPTADWRTEQHLDHVTVAVALKWPPGEPILHREGTITASSAIGTIRQAVSGTIDTQGNIMISVPYIDWYGQPVFTVTYSGSSVQIMHDATTPLEQTFTYDVLAVSYTITGQDYSETANLQFFARYQPQHPAVDTHAILQVSTGQPWIQADTTNGVATVPITVANKPLSWNIHVLAYALPTGQLTIYANQWANLQIDREDYTTSVLVDDISRQSGGLNVSTSIVSSAMWLDMNNVNATVTIKNRAGQTVAQQTYIVTIFHGQVNHYTWLVKGDYTAGAYIVEVTLTYEIPEPPATIGNTTQQLAAA